MGVLFLFCDGRGEPCYLLFRDLKPLTFASAGLQNPATGARSHFDFIPQSSLRQNEFESRIPFQHVDGRLSA